MNTAMINEYAKLRKSSKRQTGIYTFHGFLDAHWTSACYKGKYTVALQLGKPV